MKFIQAHFVGTARTAGMQGKVDTMLLLFDKMADKHMLIYYDIFHQYITPERRQTGMPFMDKVILDVIFASDQQEILEAAYRDFLDALKGAFGQPFKGTTRGCEYKDLTKDARQYLRNKYFI